MGHRLDIFRHTTALIDLTNLKHNFYYVQNLLGPSQFLCPMVKANGYGHGDVEIAKCLELAGSKQMGVGLIEEGLLLRQMGVQCDLLVFGIFDQKGANEIVHSRLTPVISLWSQIEVLEKAVKSSEMYQTKRYPVHLKFDTGMHRLGFAIQDALALLARFQGNPYLDLKGICTHLFRAEDTQDLQGDSIEQLSKFSLIEKIFSSLRVQSHSLNSAGILNFHILQKNSKALPAEISLRQGGRPGLLIYGLSPMAKDLNLRPVMSLRSHIVRYHQIKAHSTVSYSGTWRAQRDSIIGVVPIGYADGYHRLLSNRAEVLVKGKRVSQVGNVCMDYIMIDVTDVVSQSEFLDHSEIEVTLFGEDSAKNQLSAVELADKSNTITWEILTSVGERVPRVYKKGDL